MIAKQFKNLDEQVEILEEHLNDYDEVESQIMDEITGDLPMMMGEDAEDLPFEIMGNNNQHLKIDCGKFDLVAFNVPSLTNDLIKGEKMIRRASERQKAENTMFGGPGLSHFTRILNEGEFCGKGRLFPPQTL